MCFPNEQWKLQSQEYFQQFDFYNSPYAFYTLSKVTRKQTMTTLSTGSILQQQQIISDS